MKHLKKHFFISKKTIILNNNESVQIKIVSKKKNIFLLQDFYKMETKTKDFEVIQINNKQ
ncbi:MAG: hypothetical protein WCK82_09830 [Bacteroidota bacterium]